MSYDHGNYELEIWWDESDWSAHNTGWKVLCNGELYEGANRTELILEALDS